MQLPPCPDDGVLSLGRMQGIVHLTPLHTGRSPLTLRVHPFPIGSRWTPSPCVGSHPLDWPKALSSDLGTWGRCPGQAWAGPLRFILLGHRGWSPVSRITPESLCSGLPRGPDYLWGRGCHLMGMGGDTLGSGSGDMPTHRIYTALSVDPSSRCLPVPLPAHTRAPGGPFTALPPK